MDQLKKLIGFGCAVCIIGGSSPGTSRASVIVVDSPDIKIRDATNPSVEALGAEPSVAVHPDDWRNVLMGLITATSAGTTGWFSTDGGFQWHGDNEPAHSPDGSDPSVAILKGTTTRYLLQSIAGSTEQWVAWTDTPSAPWPGEAYISNMSESTDKGFICADNRQSSQYFGRLYSLWSRPNEGLYFRYSLEDSSGRGSSWDPQPDPVPLRSTGSCWGGVICVGIAPSTLGDVYVAWPTAGGFTNPPDEIHFRRSDLGGEWFASRIQITSYGSRSYAPHDPIGLNTGGGNSIPSMAADDLGSIYVAWCQRRRLGDGSGEDAQVYISKSTNNGDTWGTPIAITASGANQWLPWIAWDDETKALAAVYFDDRSDPNLADVYFAVSYDHGSSFTEFEISDAPGSGDVFVGDYISIACGGGIAYPVWCDDRESGVVKAFTSPILIGGIDSATITTIVSQHCAGQGDPRVRFEVDWTTLATMDGLDKLTITPPGQNPVVVTASSTSKTHQLVAYSIPCVNGDWTYVVESTKGSLTSQSSVLTKTVACMSCPPPCRPPCEFE